MRCSVRTIQCLLLGVLFAGCTVAATPTSTNAPPPSLDGAVSPSTKTDCLNQIVTSERVPSTISNVASFSSTIVLGTFLGYGDARWNTRDGNPPVVSDPHKLPEILIYSPVKIAVDSSLRGDAAATATARVLGGQVGCNAQRWQAAPALAVGTKYVFFVQPSRDSEVSGITDPWVAWAWPTNADGSVQTPLEGDVTLDDLAKAIADSPVVPIPTPLPEVPQSPEATQPSPSDVQSPNP